MRKHDWVRKGPNRARIKANVRYVYECRACGAKVVNLHDHPPSVDRQWREHSGLVASEDGALVETCAGGRAGVGVPDGGGGR